MADDRLLLGRAYIDNTQIDKQLSEIENRIQAFGGNAAKAFSSVSKASTTFGKDMDWATRTIQGIAQSGEKMSVTFKNVEGQLQQSKVSVTWRQNADVIRELSREYSKLSAAQSGYVSAVKTGNTTLQDLHTQDINNAKARIQAIEDEAIKTQSGRAAALEMSRKAAEGELKYRDAVEAARKSIEDKNRAEAERTQKNTDTAYLADLREQYQRLATAQREYATAVQKENVDLQQLHAANIVAAKEEIAVIEQRNGISDDALAKGAQMAKDAADAEVKYTAAVKESYDAILERNQAEAERTQKNTDETYIRAMSDAYSRLTQAQREYVAALKDENADRQAYWQNEIDNATKDIGLIHDAAAGADMTERAWQKVQQKASDVNQEYAKHSDSVNRATGEVQAQKKAQEELLRQQRQMVQQAERWLATMLVMRGLKTMWNDAVAYAKEYYDAMNEIRVVTNMTQQDADALGARYRQLAQEMSVASTEIASAAVTYFRQGLNQEEVEDRLRYTTMYAKVAAVDFNEAATLMTAAMNGMDVAADRVADVWIYLGDNAATSASEIGMAMQRVSASAQNAGVSFEWLASYIAVMSERTRQAPQVIGTALNSLISRLQQIKAKGFNDEDIFGLNDIAKALGSLERPIALMDEATGQWRDLPDILNDIAAQWSDLDDKAKSYIATVMGGTRQRNYLLTLLDDLSAGAENGSRAWELYEGAMNAAGTAMDKYATWEESVAAAQNRLTAATQEFYSLLTGEHLKAWYDALAWIISGINGVTQATGGANIGIGLLAAGITMLVLAIARLRVATAGTITPMSVLQWLFPGVGAGATTAATGVSMLGIALRGLIVGVVITGVIQLIGWLSGVGREAKDAAEEIGGMADRIKESNANYASLDDASRRLNELRDSTADSATQIAQFNALRSQMIQQFPEIADQLRGEVTKVDELRGAYENLQTAIGNVRREQIISDYLAARNNSGESQAKINAVYDSYSGGTPGKDALDSILYWEKQRQNFYAAYENNSYSAFSTADELGLRYEGINEAYAKLLEARNSEVYARYSDAIDRAIVNAEAAIQNQKTIRSIETNIYEKRRDMWGSIQDAIKNQITSSIDPLFDHSDMIEIVPDMINSIFNAYTPEDWLDTAGAGGAPVIDALIKAEVDNLTQMYDYAQKRADMYISYARKIRDPENRAA